MMNVQTHGRTDLGKTRSTNQDQFLIAVLTRALSIQGSSLSQPKLLLGEEQGQLMIVADGMGGHAAGEVASRLAVMAIEEFMLNTLKWFFALRGDGVLAEFQTALQRADERIFESAARSPELKGMGTTVTMAYVQGNVLYVAHAGDSRCYITRHGKLYRVTRDHTLTEKLITEGHLNPEDLAHNPFGNVITNAVGGSQPGVKAEVHKVELAPGDIVLLCSDGLTKMVPDQEIAAIIAGTLDTDEACRQLIARANEGGGLDNITAVVARFAPAEAAAVEAAPAAQS
jgi:protein phosphatase